MARFQSIWGTLVLNYTWRKNEHKFLHPLIFKTSVFLINLHSFWIKKCKRKLTAAVHCGTSVVHWLCRVNIWSKWVELLLTGVGASTVYSRDRWENSPWKSIPINLTEIVHRSGQTYYSVQIQTEVRHLVMQKILSQLFRSRSFMAIQVLSRDS